MLTAGAVQFVRRAQSPSRLVVLNPVEQPELSDKPPPTHKLLLSILTGHTSAGRSQRKVRRGRCS